MAYSAEVVKRARDRLAQAKADREQYYYDLAFNPEKLVTEPAPVETVAEETTLPAA